MLPNAPKNMGYEIETSTCGRNCIPADKYAMIIDGLKENNLTRLSISGHAINFDHISAIAQALQDNTSLISLELSGCIINYDGMKTLAEAIANNDTLLSLHIFRHQTGFACLEVISTGKDLIEALRANQTLQTLQLTKEMMTAQNGQTLLEVLETNRSLTTFYIERYCPRINSELDSKLKGIDACLERNQKFKQYQRRIALMSGLLFGLSNLPTDIIARLVVKTFPPEMPKLQMPIHETEINNLAVTLANIKDFRIKKESICGELSQYLDGDGEHKQRAESFLNAVIEIRTMEELKDLFEKQSDILKGNNRYHWSATIPFFSTHIMRTEKHKTDLVNQASDNDEYCTIIKEWNVTLNPDTTSTEEQSPSSFSPR